MTNYNRGSHTQYWSTAIIFIIETAEERMAHSQSGNHFIHALGLLEADITHKAVCNQHICNTSAEHHIGLHVSHKVEFGCIAHQSVCLLCRNSTLLALRSDIQKRYTWVLYTHHCLCIYRTQYCKLIEHCRLGVGIEPNIKNQHVFSVGKRYLGRNAGAQQPRQSLQCHYRACQHRSGISGTGKSIYLPLNQLIEPDTYT